MRILAIFMIAAGAMLCGLPPLFMRAFQSADAPVTRVARAFSGGIILALALVHIVPEAVMELSEVHSYPIAGVAVLFGILALVVTESSLTALWAPDDYKEKLRRQQHSHSHAPASAAAAAAATVHAAHSSGSKHGEAGGSGATVAAGGKDASVFVVPPSSAADALDAAAAQGPVPHSHACTSSLSAQRWAGGAMGALDGARRRVTAYTMELGCMFHSVIIGVGVGVITGDRQLVLVLMVALIVHQGLEGLSLGTVLALAPFSRLKKAIMVVAYSWTTSLGIAIGIAVSSTYDPDSIVSKAVQGTLNGVSGGMLLYISMYQLIAEEFSREDLVVRGRLRLGMVAGLLLGAASMCVLAMWS